MESCSFINYAVFYGELLFYESYGEFLFSQLCFEFYAIPQTVLIPIDVNFEHEMSDGSTAITTSYMMSIPEIVLNANDLQAQVDSAIGRLNGLSETY